MYDHIRIVCPKCGQSATVPAHAIGHPRQCLRCGERFTAAPAQASGTITFKCACGRQFIVPVHHAGKTGQCPDCKQPVVVPSPAAPAPTGPPPQVEEDDADSASDEQPSRKPLIIGAAAVVVALVVAGAFWLGRASGPHQTPQAALVTRDTPPPASKNKPKPAVAKVEPSARKEVPAANKPTSQPVVTVAASAPPATPKVLPLPQQAAASIAPAAAEPQPAARPTQEPSAEPTAPQPPNGPIAVVRQLEIPAARFNGLALSRDGKWLATSNAQPGEIIVWSMPDGEIVQRLPHKVSVNALAFTADAAYLVLAEASDTVAFWNRTTQVVTRSQRAPASASAVCCAPSGLNAFTCSYSNNLSLWRVPSPQPIATPAVHGVSTFGLAISPDGNRLLFGGAGGYFQLWDIPTRQAVRSFRLQGNSALAFAFSPDGRQALTGGASYAKLDGSTVPTGEMSLVLWDLMSGQELRRLGGHRDPIWAVAFTPDGHRGVSGGGVRGMRPNPAGADNNLRLWHLNTGEELARFDCGAPIRNLVLTPDGRTAICTGPEGTLWILSLGGGAGAGENQSAADIPDLLTISKRLTGELTPLITAGKYNQAIAVIDTSERDLRRFASSVNLRLWDNSIAPLFRLAEMKRAQIVPKLAKGPGTQPADDTPARYATRLTAEQTKGLNNLRTALTRAGSLIQDNNTSQARTIVYKVKGELATFVQASRVPEWHVSVAPLFQTVAKIETIIDGKRDDKPAPAVAADSPAALNTPSSSGQYLSVGQFAPAFAGMTLEGRRFSLTQLKGKWILLDFWSTGCGPCKVEMSTNLKDVYDTYGTDKRFAMLSVSIDHQVEDPANYIRQNGYKWGQMWVGGSWSSPVLKAYGVNAIPAIFLISPDGRIAASGIRGANIKAAVAHILGKK